MREHGHFQISRHGDVLLAVVADAWNAETIRAYGAELRKSLADQPADQSWALIVDARPWRLGTPEVGPELARLARWKDENGLAAAAYINDDYELKALFATDHIFRHYRVARVKLVATPAEAVSWIEAHGFEVPPALETRLQAAS